MLPPEEQHRPDQLANSVTIPACAFGSSSFYTNQCVCPDSAHWKPDPLSSGDTRAYCYECCQPHPRLFAALASCRGTPSAYAFWAQFFRRRMAVLHMIVNSEKNINFLSLYIWASFLFIFCLLDSKLSVQHAENFYLSALASATLLLSLPV